MLSYITLIVIDILLPRLPKFSEDYKKSQKIIFDRRIEDKKKQKLIDKKYQQMIFSSLYDIYPYNEIIKKKNFINIAPPANAYFILCSEGYGNITFKSDRFGFRNLDKIWDEEIDTVLIGDSAAEGECVQQNKTISGILNKENIKTIVLANGGYSAIHYAFVAKIFLEHIKPKNVIILFHENDNHLIDHHMYHMKYFHTANSNDFVKFTNGKLAPTKKVIEFNNDIVKIQKNTDKNSTIVKLKINLSKFKKYLLLSNLRQHIYFLTTDNIFQSNKMAINEVLNFCLENNCNTYFSLLGSSEFWDPNFFYNDYKRNLGNYLRLKNKKLIVFDDIIDYKDKKYFAVAGPHLSPLGYGLVAKKYLEILKNENTNK